MRAPDRRLKLPEVVPALAVVGVPVGLGACADVGVRNLRLFSCVRLTWTW